MDPEKKNEELKLIKGMAAAAVLTGAAFSLGFFLVGMFPGGERIFMTGDLLLQYAPINRLFWKGILDGRDMSWSFSLGAGMDGMADYALYCLSPFHILYGLIEDADLASFLVVSMKLMLAAACFFRLAVKYHNSTYTIAVVCAVFYALCGYSSGFTCFVVFLDMVYLLPLVCCGIHKGLRREGFSELVIIYAISFMIFYYGAYMMGIFSFIFFLIMLLGRYEYRGKKAVVFLFHYFATVIVAIMISAVVTLPAGVYMLSNRAEDSTGFINLKINALGIISNLFIGQFQGYAGRLPLIYSGCLSLLCIPGMIWKEISRKEMVKSLGWLFWVFFILCLFVPPFYLMIHAFDMPDTFYFRFSYVFSFMILLKMAETYENDCRSNKRTNVLTAVFFVLLYVVLYFFEIKTENKSGMSLTGLMVNAAFLSAWWVADRIPDPLSVKKWLFQIIVFLECTINIYLMQTPDDNGLLRQNRFYRMWKTQGEAGNTLDGDEPYRVYYENSLFSNDPAFFDYKGVSYFYTAEHPAYRNALKDLGYASSARVLCDYGSTPVSRMLLAQKYMIHGTDPRYESTDAFTAVRNDHVLPLGFMVSEDIRHYEATDDPFENQNRLLFLMNGSSGEAVYDHYDQLPLIREEGLECGPKDGGYRFTRTSQEGAARAVFNIPYEEGRQAYAYFVPEISGLWPDSALLVSESTDTGMIAYDSLLSFAHILPMGQDESGMNEAAVYITEDTPEEQSCKKAFFAYFDGEAFIGYYNALLPGGMEIKSFKDTEIIARVTAGEDKRLLFTSIPYDENWHVYLDGEETGTEAVLDGAFLAAELTAGEHELRFVYSNKWLFSGSIISLIGLITLFLMRKRELRRDLHGVIIGRSGDPIKEEMQKNGSCGEERGEADGKGRAG